MEINVNFHAKTEEIIVISNTYALPGRDVHGKVIAGGASTQNRLAFK